MSMNVTNSNTSLRVLLALAAFIIVIAGFKAASSLIIAFLMSAFIAIICAPPVLWMQARGVPFVVALICIILTIVAIGGLLASLVGNSVNEFTTEIPVYEQRLTNYSHALCNWLDEKGLTLAKEQLTGSLIRLQH